MAAKKHKPKRKPSEREKYGWRKRQHRAIYERWLSGDSQRALAHDYGFHPSTISRIIARANGA